MAKKAAQHHCSRCEQTFNSRQALSKHIQNHPDTEPATLTCTICNWPFEDSLALEQHNISNGHFQTTTVSQRLEEYRCDRCPAIFNTKRGYNCHRELGKSCSDAEHATDWKKRSRGGPSGWVDLDKPRVISKQVHELAYGGDSSDTPSEGMDGAIGCRYCKKAFTSEFAHDSHLLGCKPFNSKLTPDTSPETACAADRDQNLAPISPTADRHIMTSAIPAPRATKATILVDASHPMPLQTVTLNTKAPMPRQTQAPLQGPVVSSTGIGAFVCNINGCQRSYNSEPGLKMHQTDAHGVGGIALDLYGRDSWMLGQRERERLRAEGLLRNPTGPARGGKGSRGGSRGGRTAPVSAKLALAQAPPQAVPARRVPVAHSSYYQAPPHHVGISTPPPLPTSQNIGGALEMEQAKIVCGKTLRLLLQTDIFIHHDGKMNVSGIDWTRIGVQRQPDVVGMFDGMCHLPRRLQPLEYVPAPKTFLAEYTAQYPVTEFESPPDRNPAKPGLGIIAMACSKVVLSNGQHEVVKIAAIDVLTCRVLMSHLVCTHSNNQVANWHKPVTGLSSFADMEAARQAGYRVLKGWTAARSALFKFIDKETIIVGHNLRSELDALRIIHGRAIDIVKIVEKAAQGPLSKAQVSLDSWCRDVANVATLKKDDKVFGRDYLMRAFAAREIGLWVVKNREQFEKVAKQKSTDYQLINPVKA